jgi:hypothetical protein
MGGYIPAYKEQMHGNNIETKANESKRKLVNGSKPAR